MRLIPCASRAPDPREHSPRRRQGDWDIGTADMQTKILELIIPKGASQKQIEQLQLLREYAQQYEIQFTIIIAN